MSVMFFMAIALSDHRVTDCLHVKEMDEVMESFPLMDDAVPTYNFTMDPRGERRKSIKELAYWDTEADPNCYYWILCNLITMKPNTVMKDDGWIRLPGKSLPG
ncbi:hypothetical protein OIU78_006670 [Salix suchowensis]|nr:hypothetical protein OIU78_006670 [Salix suchowensis]